MKHAQTVYEEKMTRIAELLEELILDALLAVIRNLYDRNMLEEQISDKEDMPF